LIAMFAVLAGRFTEPWRSAPSAQACRNHVAVSRDVPVGLLDLLRHRCDTVTT